VLGFITVYSSELITFAFQFAVDKNVINKLEIVIVYTGRVLTTYSEFIISYADLLPVFIGAPQIHFVHVASHHHNNVP